MITRARNGANMGAVSSGVALVLICTPILYWQKGVLGLGELQDLPVTISPRCPHCGGRLYSVRANKPGLGSTEDSVLPFGYCWECQELFRVTIELERVKAHDIGQHQQGHSKAPTRTNSSNPVDARSQSVQEKQVPFVNRTPLNERES